MTIGAPDGSSGDPSAIDSMRYLLVYIFVSRRPDVILRSIVLPASVLLDPPLALLVLLLGVPSTKALRDVWVSASKVVSSLGDVCRLKSYSLMQD